MAEGECALRGGAGEHCDGQVPERIVLNVSLRGCGGERRAFSSAHPLRLPIVFHGRLSRAYLGKTTVSTLVPSLSWQTIVSTFVPSLSWQTTVVELQGLGFCRYAIARRTGRSSSTTQCRMSTLRSRRPTSGLRSASATHQKRLLLHSFLFFLFGNRSFVCQDRLGPKVTKANKECCFAQVPRRRLP